MIVTLIDPYRQKQETPPGVVALSAGIPRSLTSQNILKQLIRLELIGEEWTDGILVTTQDARYVCFIINYCPYGDLYSIMRAQTKKVRSRGSAC